MRYIYTFFSPSSFFKRSATFLIQAKKFVESLPKILKENLSKEDAEKLQKTFEAIGAVVKLE